MVSLAQNGLRLRFDGPEQRLRLLEVLDFRKASIEYDGIEIFKHPDPSQSGPSYRSLSKLLGPTFPGEFIEGDQEGVYVLSYPGLAFSFSVNSRAWASRKDDPSALSSNAASAATSMAVFAGKSWADGRTALYGQPQQQGRGRAGSLSRLAESPDDVEMLKLYGEGRVEVVKRAGPTIRIVLGETTPQDLVAELGAPDSIYRKYDRRLAIHKDRASERDRSSSADTGYSSSRHGETDDSDGEDANPAMSAEAKELSAAEHFYNYSRYGFDLLISTPTAPSAPSPTMPEAKTLRAKLGEDGNVAGAHLTATKLIIHGNVPSSWVFGRHRRCRWQLEHVPTARDTSAVTSEGRFSSVAARLSEVFGSGEKQKGMQLNRGWADSPSSSVELLGGWEEDATSRPKGSQSSFSGREQGVSSTSELYGWPGLVFEVLPNDAVSALTVY